MWAMATGPVVMVLMAMAAGVVLMVMVVAAVTKLRKLIEKGRV